MSTRSDLAGARIAIANRAEIAVRVATTCRRLGMIPVLLATDPDMTGYAARQIGRIAPLGPASAQTDVEAVVAAATRAGAAFLHPGYGFLSERADLAAACAAAGITFVGPSPETLALCGDKIHTRASAQRAGVPLLPASDLLADEPAEWLSIAASVGYPLLVKPAHAGGGRGMRRVGGGDELVAAIEAARREAAESGAGSAVFLERELIGPRHVEVQVAGDGRRAIAIGDRDCSLQRRHQKLIEEAPAPNLEEATRAALHRHAVAIAEEVGLRGFGTCEFLVGDDSTIAFLEVNPRLQVEHPVTELTSGVDLVAWQLRLAGGEPLATRAPEPRGYAIEARIYAEDPERGFLPSPGDLIVVEWPQGPNLRVDAGYASGDAVPSAYDPMLAKIIAGGETRAAAIGALRDALRATVVSGVATNIPWLLAALCAPEIVAGETTTATADRVTTDATPRQLAIAAAVARTLDRPAAADPWVTIGPMRLTGAATLFFHGDDWEEQVEVRAGRDQTLVRFGADDEQPLAWYRGPNGIWTIRLGDQVGRFGFGRATEPLEIAGAAGRLFIATGAQPTAIARAAQHADSRVRSPLPGKVLRIEATVGAEVSKGEPLVTLSAMKIELVCAAPESGVVTAVHCAVGDQIEAGTVLVELRYAPEDVP